MIATDHDTSSMPHRVARVVAEVFAPAVCAGVVSITVSLTSSPTLVAGIVWTAVSAGFCALLPFWFMSHGARTGKWDTHHVRDRKDRIVPLSVSIASVAGGLAILLLGGAPRPVIALVAAMLVCLAMATVVTKWWKMSLHAAIAAGSVGILALTFGPWWLLGLAVVALVAWSRMLTADHTGPQVAVGSVVGLALGGGLYALLL